MEGAPMPTDEQRVDGHEHKPDPKQILSPHRLRCEVCDEEITYVNGFWRKAPSSPVHNALLIGGPRDQMSMNIPPHMRKLMVHLPPASGFYYPTPNGWLDGCRVWLWVGETDG